MKLSAKTLYLALYRVLASEGIGTGCTLPLRHLMQAWSQTGLRQSDLARALEYLLADGFGRLESTAEGPVLRVLDEQFGLLRPGTEDRSLVEQLDQIRHARRHRDAHLGTLAGVRDGRRDQDRRPVAEAA